MAATARLLASIAVVLAVSCACATGATFQAEVVIIGGGAAGIQAAKNLQSAGVTDVILLEAKSRIGGRVSESPLKSFADGSVLQNSDGNQVNVELGAAWLRANGASNPAFKLATASGIVSVLVNRTRAAVYYNGNVEVDGLTTSPRWRTAINATRGFAQLAQQFASGNRTDISLRSALRTLGWSPLGYGDAKNVSLSRVFDYFANEYERGDLAEATSLLYGNPSLAYAKYNSTAAGDRLVQDFRGLRKTLTDLAGAVFTNASRLRVNSPVASVSYGIPGALIDVTTEAGDVFRAKSVIVAVSAGVLRSGKITFTPALPAWKLSALDRIEIVSQVRAVFAFPAALWSGNTEFLLSASGDRGSYSVFHVLNSNNALGDVTLLEVTATGDEAARLEQLSDSDIAAEVSAALQKMFPTATATARTPTHYAISRWSTDERVLGAATVTPVGLDSNAAKDIAAPVGRIYFAGEHTSGVLSGTVQGALESGSVAADRVAACSKYGVCPALRSSEPPTCLSPPPIPAAVKGSGAATATSASLLTFVAAVIVSVAVAMCRFD